MSAEHRQLKQNSHSLKYARLHSITPLDVCVRMCIYVCVSVCVCVLIRWSSASEWMAIPLFYSRSYEFCLFFFSTSDSFILSHSLCLRSSVFATTHPSRLPFNLLHHSTIYIFRCISSPFIVRLFTSIVRAANCSDNDLLVDFCSGIRRRRQYNGLSENH